MKRAASKIIKWILGTCCALILMGFISEQVFRFHFDRLKPVRHTFYKVHDREIYARKKGKGGATVIFESGMGRNQTYWTEIQDQLSKKTTTLSDDRAGIVWSDPVGLKSLRTISNDLYQVMQKTQCPKPYILVGHSLAGITMHRFLKNHSVDIAGVVFIDVSHPLQQKRSSKNMVSTVKALPKWTVSFFNEIGLGRMMYSFNSFTRAVPKDHPINTHARDYFYKLFQGLFQEMDGTDLFFQLAEAITDFGDIPLTLITATYPDGIDKIDGPLLVNEYLTLHHESQKSLLELTTDSKQAFANNK